MYRSSFTGASVPHQRIRLKGNLSMCKYSIQTVVRSWINQLMVEATETIDIKRLLSAKGCLCDNATAEATYKSFKIGFMY